MSKLPGRFDNVEAWDGRSGNWITVDAALILAEVGIPIFWRDVVPYTLRTIAFLTRPFPVAPTLGSRNSVIVARDIALAIWAFMNLSEPELDSILRLDRDTYQENVRNLWQQTLAERGMKTNGRIEYSTE